MSRYLDLTREIVINVISNVHTFEKFYEYTEL